MRERLEPYLETKGGKAGAWAGGLFLAWLLAQVVLPDGAPLAIVLLGVAFGTITALLAIGLILTYRTNRIINFAYAAMGGVGGVLGVHLFTEAGWNYYLSIVAGVAVGLVVGGLTDLLVIRRFRNASRLIVTVATIGLAQLYGGIQLYIPQWFESKQGGLIGGLTTPLSGFGVNIGPVYFNGNHMLILASVPPIILGLAWFLLKTDAGVAVRAAAENRDRATLLGIPIERLTTLVWIVVGGLASLTFLLKAPFAGAVSTALGGPTLLLPALAAAVIARMESLPRAFVAGIGLGILEQVVFWNTGKATANDVAFLVVILVALLLQREHLTRAQDAGDGTWSMAEAVRRIPVELRSLPEVRAVKWGGIALLLAAGIFVPRIWAVNDQILASLALIYAIVAVSLVVLTGWGGNISLGQFAMAGVGGLVTGNLAVNFNVDMFVILLIAGAAGGITALVVGLPALRIRGLFLAVTTLAFAVALDSYFLNPNNNLGIVKQSVNRPNLFQRWDLNNELTFYYVVFTFFVITILVANQMRQTRAGRVLLAVKDNHRAASAAAVNVTNIRLTGFVFSGIIAGIAGGLFVYLVTGMGQGAFAPAASLDIFSMATIGGLSSIGGAISGVFLFRWLSKILSGELRLIVTGVGLLVVLMVIPGGLMQLFLSFRDRLLRGVAHRRGIHVPSLLEDKRVSGEGDEGGDDHAPDELEIVAGAMAEEPEPAEVVETTPRRPRRNRTKATR
ncbi:MAG TPA: ABC transporter permease [Acidimicrobiia bacterium]|nr:ABC transporter permease [Acidimicrobiia bacterium]